jgi:hypothetical protein
MPSIKITTGIVRSYVTTLAAALELDQAVVAWKRSPVSGIVKSWRGQADRGDDSVLQRN